MTWTLITGLSLDEVNLCWPELQRAGMLGAAEVDGHTSVYFPRPVRDLPIPGRWEQIPDRDWTMLWRSRLTPVRVGSVVVTPPWLATGARARASASEPGGGDPTTDEIIIDPGQAFGTGHHETTVMCLRALLGRKLQGRRVLDLGTGSGVLAIAAARAGARVLALDTDPVAVAAAEDNVRRNGAKVDLRVGSLEAAGTATFDVIVANLDTETLIRLAPALAERLQAGALIASGTGNERSGDVAGAFSSAGMRVEVERGREWSLLIATEPRVRGGTGA